MVATKHHNFPYRKKNMIKLKRSYSDSRLSVRTEIEAAKFSQAEKDLDIARRMYNAQCANLRRLEKYAPDSYWDEIPKGKE